MLHTYAIAPPALRRMLRRSMARLLFVVTASYLAFGLFLLTAGRPVVLGMAAAVIVVIGLVYFLILFVNYRTQLRLLYSIRVDMDGSGITFRQAGQEPHRVLFSQVTRVREQADGLLVETVDPRQALLVPNGLSRGGDEAVREALSAWRMIEPLLQRQNPASRAANLLGFGGALAVLLFANSLWVIVPLGLFLFAYGVYAERRLERTRGVAPGTLRLYNSAFSFLLLVVLMKACVLSIILAVR